VLESETNAIDEEKKVKEKEIKVLKTKLIISSFFSLPILFLAM
jgi:hypothetical protein